MASAHLLATVLTTATGAQTGFEFSGGTHGGSFVASVAGAGTATVTLEGSVDGTNWYSVQSFAGTPAAVSIALGAGATATQFIGGEHRWLRANVTAHGVSGTLTVYFVPRPKF